jgi:hypothetical protein
MHVAAACTAIAVHLKNKDSGHPYSVILYINGFHDICPDDCNWLGIKLFHKLDIHNIEDNLHNTFHLLGKYPCKQMFVWAYVLLGKRPSGQMSFWANVFWANVVLGQMSLGKCLWANVSGQMSYGQMSYGQMLGHHINDRLNYLIRTHHSCLLKIS